ncbi:hypothetical protein EYC84_003729 [Monilinia fructicola]|uniref:Uncharacterized protein n=1 Tax=Monilinia fructicola TaxID=38448 RepID=A0A5M9JZV0_MONFR|nr:hypothetical protein EYC84_003729 [Monilinia fructicola]
MVLSKKQESIIIDILGFAPETWIPAIALQVDKIPAENRVEFGERLLNRISSYQVKVQHTASILRRGPNLDPKENHRAFSLMHASYLSHLFIAHPTLCERLCDNLIKQTHNHGWKYKVDQWREIETNKLQIKDQLAEEIHRAPRSETDDRFSLLEIMDAMEYVGQHPTTCRKMLDLWPEYRVFQEYNLEAWSVIEGEVEEESKQEQRAAASAREGMSVEHPSATTRITRSKNDKGDTNNNGEMDEKEPEVKKARYRYLDSSLGLASALESERVDATHNPGANGPFDFVHAKKLAAVVVSDRISRSMKKVGAVASSTSSQSEATIQAPAELAGTMRKSTNEARGASSVSSVRPLELQASAEPVRVLRRNRQRTQKYLSNIQNELLLKADPDA